MALICANGSRTASGPGRMFSGVTTVAGGYRRENIGVPHSRLNWFAGNHTISGVTDRGAIPAGYRHPGAWLPPRKSGGLSSRNSAVITFTPAGNAAQGINLDGTTSITFTVSGSAAAVASAACTTAITFTTAGNAVAPLQAIGAASITFTTTGDLSAPASLTGTATITFDADMITGAIGHMVAEPIDQSLTPDSIALSVWSAVAASNNDVGTMGEKLNDAGSAANPWTEVIESGFTAAQILRLLAAYVAGDATGMNGSAEFTGLDGSTVRIEGTVTGGDRSITGLNVV